METLTNKEEIFARIPDITSEDIEGINRLFTPYLFFEDNKDYRECWCTACGQNFTYNFSQHTETPEHFEFLQAKHNGAAKCPRCGAAVTAKVTYRAKECKNLYEYRRGVIIKPVSENEVYLICVWCDKDYSGKNYLARLYYDIETVYYLAPGTAKLFKKNRWLYKRIISAADFYEPKTLQEPFRKTYTYNTSNIQKRGYHLVNAKDLGNTFLRYAPVDEFYDAWRNFCYDNIAYYYRNTNECPLVKFLAYSAIYPGVEILIKNGLGDLVCSLVNRKPMKRYINWSGRNPKEIFKMTNAQFHEMAENFNDIPTFKLYQTLKNVSKKVDFSFCSELIKGYYYEGAQRIANTVKKHKLNLTHTLNYLKKNCKRVKSDYSQQAENERIAIMWCDYIQFASELKYDLSRKDSDIYFPKKLNSAHDNASRALTIKKDETAFENYKKRYEKLQKLYEYTDGKYCIVIPMGINDIVDEGKILSHCVGGYADRHIIGKTTILFMRSCSDPEKRLVTIEIDESNKRIRQNYGYKDRIVTAEEQAFIDKWIKWVRTGSKRKKNKKTASAA